MPPPSPRAWDPPAASGPFDDTLVTTFTESWFFLMLRRFVRFVFQIYALFFGSPMLREVIGPTYLEDFFESYVVELFSSAAHLDTLFHLVWGACRRAGALRALVAVVSLTPAAGRSVGDPAPCDLRGRRGGCGRRPELEGHSVFHLLPDIKQPVLILTGIFDPVIPAYQGATLLDPCTIDRDLEVHSPRATPPRWPAPGPCAAQALRWRSCCPIAVTSG